MNEDIYEGHVFDLGYRHYDGPREGRSRAWKALFVNGIRSLFGIGRGAWAKALPVLFFIAAMAPAAVLATISGLFGEIITDIADLPGPELYYQIISPLLLIFAAVMAPELLCTDRKEGVLNLYLVRPMTSTDYVLGRWAAFFFVSVILIWSGQILLQTGLALGASDTTEYLRENWLDIPRFMGAGLAIAVITTTLPLAAAAFTDRRAYASVIVIGLFIVSSIVSGVLGTVDCESYPLTQSGAVCEPRLGETARWVSQMVDIGNVQLRISDMIFGVYDNSDDAFTLKRIPEVAAVAWYIVVSAVAGFLLWNRYRRLAR